MKSVGLESGLRANETFLDRGTESYLFKKNTENQYTIDALAQSTQSDNTDI